MCNLFLFGEKLIGGDKEILTNSKEMAEKFSKDHDKVCKAIRNLIRKNPELTEDFIILYFTKRKNI